MTLMQSAFRSLVMTLCVLAACSSPESRPAADANLDATAREHASHTPGPNSSFEEPQQPVLADKMSYRNGNPRLPAVIMVHEWWGLNDNIRMMARRLAGEGYQVLAVDLFDGQVATTSARARSLVEAASKNPDAAISNLQGAATFLRERGAPRVAVLGWCFGGGWSLQAALQIPEQVDAAVVFYGRPETDRGKLARLDVPLLAMFGSEDGSIPVAQVREMEATLRQLGKDVDVRIYEGASHAFANPSGPAYEPQAAADVWGRTTTFLANHLK
jgi:carboxymethylenebutenolidase